MALKGKKYDLIVKSGFHNQIENLIDSNIHATAMQYSILVTKKISGITNLQAKVEDGYSSALVQTLKLLG